MSRAVRLLVAAAALVVLVVVLFEVVFPWVDRTFVADPVLEAAAQPQAVSVASHRP